MGPRAHPGEGVHGQRRGSDGGEAEPACRRATQEALQQLACLGNSADLTTLALMRRTSEDQVRADLWEAVRLELIERLDGSFRFVHDRIQEAAYSLISEPLRAAAHLQIEQIARGAHAKR